MSAQKPAIKLQIENGILSTELGETEVQLGRHGDSLITPIKITMPINNDLWVHDGDDICFEVVFTLEGKEIGRIPITALATVNKIGFGEMWLRMLGRFLLK